MRPRIAKFGLAVLLLATSSCSTLKSAGDSLFGEGAPPVGTAGAVTGFLGASVADEPRAALVGREILSAGGSAVDAAVAIGFALAVTLPSRAGLGGGGACLAFRSGRGGTMDPQAVLFPAPAPANGAGSSRPAAVPLLARGLFALHARFGARTFESLITPAEQLARAGFPASRALVRDLGVVGGALAADPDARDVFFATGRTMAEGTLVVQAALAGTLAQIRTAGVGDFFQGAMARRLVEAAGQVGGTFTTTDLRAALPKIEPPIVIAVSGGDKVAFVPPPADGGLAAAAAFKSLLANPGAGAQASARALGAAARWRQGGATVASILDGDAAGGSLPPLPASTTFSTLDRDGNAVTCALSMGNLFGTGRVAPGTGVVLAASPNWIPPALLSVAMAYNPNLQAFRASVGGSGQAGAPMAVADGMLRTLTASSGEPSYTVGVRPTPNQPLPGLFGSPGSSAPATLDPGAVPEPGRANMIACTKYLPGREGSCAWATDPRGAGLAVGSN